MNETKEKKKIGRPFSGKRRDQYVCIPLQLSEKQAMQIAAQKLGISNAGLFRKLLFDYLEIN
jgi:hypothetical protein